MSGRRNINNTVHPGFNKDVTRQVELSASQRRFPPLGSFPRGFELSRAPSSRAERTRRGVQRVFLMMTIAAEGCQPATFNSNGTYTNVAQLLKVSSISRKEGLNQRIFLRLRATIFCHYQCLVCVHSIMQFYALVHRFTRQHLTNITHNRQKEVIFTLLVFTHQSGYMTVEVNDYISLSGLDKILQYINWKHLLYVQCLIMFI